MKKTMKYDFENDLFVEEVRFDIPEWQFRIYFEIDPDKDPDEADFRRPSYWKAATYTTARKDGWGSIEKQYFPIEVAEGTDEDLRVFIERLRKAMDPNRIRRELEKAYGSSSDWKDE